MVGYHAKDAKGRKMCAIKIFEKYKNTLNDLVDMCISERFNARPSQRLGQNVSKLRVPIKMI